MRLRFKTPGALATALHTTKRRLNQLDDDLYENVLEAFLRDVEKLKLDPAPIVRHLARRLDKPHIEKKPPFKINFGHRLRFLLLFKTPKQIMTDLASAGGLRNVNRLRLRRWSTPEQRIDDRRKTFYLFHGPRDKQEADRRMTVLLEAFVVEMSDLRNRWPWQTEPYVFDVLIEVGRDAIDYEDD